MNEMTVLELGRNALVTTLLLSAPMLVGALLVGLVVSVFQALTQINEATLAFVPKILAVFAVIAVAGPWLINTMLSYTVSLFQLLPSMAR